MTSPLLFDCSKDEQSFHVVEVAVSPLTQVLSYRVPTESPISVGFRVSVPLGNRTTFGVVIRRNVKEHSLSQGFQLKAVHGDETPIPVLHPSQLPFLEWIADYYGDSLSSVIDTCIPNIALPKPVEMLSINSTQESLDLKGSKQKQIVAFLRERGGEVLSSELRKIFPSSGQSLLTLKKKGIVQSSLRAHVPWYKNSNREAHPSLLSPPQLILSPEQERARIEIESALENEEFLPVLLHGVTGSGKTEVYIQTIHTARKKGLGALVLVPEIALTPQLVDRFRAHFGDQVAVLHSALDKRARWEMWEGILKGELPIVIGARSAIFAPLPRLGIVVVDEEHDSSFKQAERFRYNGRDLAVKRAQLCSCPVVLGSATPSLESFYNAAQKRYRYLPLPNRAGTAEHNTFTVVNLNSVKRKE
ncbi:MAG: primosomal protein N', partial [Bdellovibrionales bacterium]|nr:primosomal protein N' [Bdellovibrionales bacterium]